MSEELELRQAFGKSFRWKLLLQLLGSTLQATKFLCESFRFLVGPFPTLHLLPESFHLLFQQRRIECARMCPILFHAARMKREKFHRSRQAAVLLTDGGMPSSFRIIRGGRREPLCARRQGDARKIGLFHRIHQEDGRTLRHSFIQSLYGAERELSRQIIRHWIVPPDAKRPSIKALGLRHIFGAYAFGHDAFSREQNDDIVIELRGKFARVGLRHASSLHILQKIFRRHDKQWLFREVTG